MKDQPRPGRPCMNEYILSELWDYMHDENTRGEATEELKESVSGLKWCQNPHSTATSLQAIT